MARIEDLADRYGRHIATPWQRTIAGAQRVVMVVYDKELERARAILQKPEVTPNTVVAILGAGALFGFARISQILKLVEGDILGRLVVFFPGQFERNNYRLLDARDGWNYLAVPITLHGEGGNS